MLKYAMIGTMLLLTLAGCGEEDSFLNTNNKSSEEVSGSSGIVAGSLEPTLTLKAIKNNTATVLYRLQNQTEQVQTIQFPSSQKYDYVLSNDKGETLKSYSANKSFAKEKENVELKQAEVLEYTIMIEDLSPGDYTLEMWLATDEQYKQSINFSVE